MTQQVLQVITFFLIAALAYFLIFYVLFEIKLDRTKEGDWLLWYTAYDRHGNAKRKYTILFKNRE